MVKALSLVFCFSLLYGFSESKQVTLLPEALGSLNLSYIQKVGSCSYTITITTSCSSSKYTRDQISISFGDSYGNQIYAPRLDDPYTRTFEQCSTDTFQIYGPCAYQICFAYLYRSGPDGWKPSSVKISGYYSGDAMFNYNTFIPDDVWYGFDLCHNDSPSHKLASWGWFVSLIVGFCLSALL
ncbi:hypothetical protein HS088_TW08G00165 [Tripterygium wilfordii]|uniref:Embryo-specific protein ATS3B n=1 Tax=Tripterygium wilfordii TaxID=458696 RepID=A0A7J7DB96_TRIWF|nr:embryo-specific protein ATS3B-like [Tripterygium wilfordii]KAF5743581.1 hypothetical protein HS088_TW08G00165 [Tripterygium wilfordii]